MLFVLGALVGGLGVGALLGGSLQRLASRSLHRAWLLLAAVLVQVVAAAVLSGAGYVAGLLASLALAVAFVLANPNLAGRGLLVGGLALNALVIAVNGAMPVSLVAAARAGVATGPLASDPRHTIEDSSTRLRLLDDRIPLPLPVGPQVLSAGDLLVAAGVGLLVVEAMRRRVIVLPSAGSEGGAASLAGVGRTAGSSRRRRRPANADGSEQQAQLSRAQLSRALLAAGVGVPRSPPLEAVADRQSGDAALLLARSTSRGPSA